KIMSNTKDDVADLQRAAVKRRFGRLRGNLPMLDKLADSQGINDIDAVEDLVPLLFGQSMYKSYPPSLLEKGRYDQLTTWLNKLVTVDLTKLDVSGCKSVDDWMLLLKREAD